MGWRTSFIGGWDIGATCALVIMYFRLRRSSASAMKQIAAEQDVGKWWVLGLSLAAGTAGLVVITSEMRLVKDAADLERALRVLLVIYSVALSWAFIQTVFALHYAHDYYLAVEIDGDKHRPTTQRSLLFPGDRPPSYGDFLYFSFTVGMTFQVSDVQIADASMRRLVLAHGIVAFFFATGILALALNLVAGLVDLKAG
ncbi:MAG TPA: DUF1345 domain-containing protein [Casimicrobiaceae bacterium]|nr:DUF1345 domain-containing protein [Casimicrobiaceae bacterium]